MWSNGPFSLSVYVNVGICICVKFQNCVCGDVDVDAENGHLCFVTIASNIFENTNADDDAKCEWALPFVTVAAIVRTSDYSCYAHTTTIDMISFSLVSTASYHNPLNHCKNTACNWVFPKYFHWNCWIYWQNVLWKILFEPVNSCVRDRDDTGHR